MNQASIGASDAIAVVVSVVRAARHATVLAAAARALGAISWSSYINKTRFAEAGAIPALLNVATEFAVGRPEVTSQYAAAVESSLHALASLMLQRQNHLLLSDCDGPRRLVALCDSTEEMKALASGAMVLAVCAPTPEQRWDAYAEGRRIGSRRCARAQPAARAPPRAFCRALLRLFPSVPSRGIGLRSPHPFPQPPVHGRARRARAPVGLRPRRGRGRARARAAHAGAGGRRVGHVDGRRRGRGRGGPAPWLIAPIRAMQMTQAQLDEEKKRLMAIGTAPSIAAPGAHQP